MGKSLYPHSHQNGQIQCVARNKAAGVWQLGRYQELGFSLQGKKNEVGHINLSSRVPKLNPAVIVSPGMQCLGAGEGAGEDFLKILSSVLWLESQPSPIPVVNGTGYFFSMKYCGLPAFPRLPNFNLLFSFTNSCWGECKLVACVDC